MKAVRAINEKSDAGMSIVKNESIKYPKSTGNAYYEKSKSITICHGSSQIIKYPKFGVGEQTNDYGMGFYTVFGQEIELAREWACSPYNDTDRGYVNIYSFDTEKLSILDFDKMDIIYWIVLTATYRKPNVDEENLKLLQKKYLIDTSLFDCICGWRCDDTFSRIITTFMNNGCTDEAIREAVHLGHLKQQFVVMSENAFSHIHYEEYHEVKEFNKYRERFNSRKEDADVGLNRCIRNNRTNGKYLEDYMEELNGEYNIIDK